MKATAILAIALGATAAYADQPMLLTIYAAHIAVTRPIVMPSLEACRTRGEMMLRAAVELDNAMVAQLAFSCTTVDGSPMPEPPDMEM
jgi:hypothetical protein